MTWLCALKWSVVVLVWLVSVATAAIVAHAWGYMRADRKHWKMLHRVGSRFGQD